MGQNIILYLHVPQINLDYWKVYIVEIYQIENAM
jgi:hypothetical protein